MKARFIDENNISITPESEEERILFHRFAQLLASNQKKLNTSFAYEVGYASRGRYYSLGLGLFENKEASNDEKR